jgi:hypothetical protein
MANTYTLTFERMNDIDKHILATLARWHAEHAAEKPPPGPWPDMDGIRWSWEIRGWHGVERYGWRIVDLYTDGYNDAARMRVSRSLTRLQKAGLVLLFGADQNRTHVKLSKWGLEFTGRRKQK